MEEIIEDKIINKCAEKLIHTAWHHGQWSTISVSCNKEEYEIVKQKSHYLEEKVSKKYNQANEKVKLIAHLTITEGYRNINGKQYYCINIDPYIVGTATVEDIKNLNNDPNLPPR